jgi:small subunit ribosomal protein S8
MSMQDPIADMLTRIRNAGMASLKEIKMPSSKMKSSIAKVLRDSGYIKNYREVEEVVGKSLIIEMKYYKRKPVIEGIKRISKPSCRTYCGSSEIPKVRNGLGITVLSTPKGILSGHTAAKEHVGGEVLCYVW